MSTMSNTMAAMIRRERLSRLGILEEPMGYVDGHNLYQFVQSNPVNLLDPMGLQAVNEGTLYDNLGLDGAINDYINFWTDWLGLADKNRKPINDDCKAKLKCMVRAMLWVESKHGTAGANQPGRDPMQVGNPGDPAWPHITNQPGGVPGGRLGPRPIRRGALPGVDWPALPGTVAKDPKLPKGIDPTVLPQGGHRDPAFNKNMSAFWGILWYLQKMNQDNPGGNPKAAWNCGDCSWDHVIDGAVRYNGGGDPQYKQKIEEALRLSGCKQ